MMKSNISSGFEIIEDLIKLKWIPEILESIYSGNQHYTEIRRDIGEISHTELNRKLALLIEKETIEKYEDQGYTSYSLLEFGKELVHIFNHLVEIQEKYCDMGWN